MMTARKLTLAETLEAARLQGEIDEVVKETLAKSDAEIEAEVRADGLSEAMEERLRERGLELLARTAPKRKDHRFAKGVGVGALGMGSLAAALEVAGVIGRAAAPLATVAASPTEHAAELRRQAFEACGRGHWDECVAKFDEAKKLDEPGDADPEIAAARKRAADRK
jgi:hypothetical protein